MPAILMYTEPALAALGSEMPPLSTVDDGPNGHLTDVVFGGKQLLRGSAGGVPTQDISDLRFRQLGGTVAFALSQGDGADLHASRLSGNRSPLCVHISDVVCGCSEEEMVGADARSYIAAVADVHACWDRPKVDLVREAMGVHLSSVDRDEPVSADAICGASPQPTSIAFLDFAPEASKEVLTVSSGLGVNAIEATESSTAVSHITGLDAELFVARLANTDQGWTGTGTLSGHRETSSRGVAPPAIRSRAGASLRSLYHAGVC